MGLIGSDELSTIDFHARAEQLFMLCAATWRKYGIICFFRYKDDILIGMDGGSALQAELLAEFRSRSAPYVLKLDEGSYTHVRMLDVCIVKSGRGFKFEMFAKPTLQGIPLCSTSMHATNIHYAWPDERLKHFRKICSDTRSSDIAKCRMIARLIKYIPEHVWLHGSTSSQRVARPSRVGGSWIVLPFHRCFESPVVRACVAEIEASFASVQLAEFAPRISFKNGYRNIQMRTSGLYHDFVKSCG
jgi:hypothetical protein